MLKNFDADLTRPAFGGASHFQIYIAAGLYFRFEQRDGDCGVVGAATGERPR